MSTLPRIVAGVLVALIAATATAHSPPRPSPSRSLEPATANASPSRADCSGTCVVDVAFSYYPEALTVPHFPSGDGGFAWQVPRTHSELASGLRKTFPIVNGIFQASGVDVVFRMTGLEPFGSGRPAAGADLWYVIDPEGYNLNRDYVPAGWATLPIREPETGSPSWHAPGFDGGLGIVPVIQVRPGTSVAGVLSYLGYGEVLAHEFGHSLGLNHGLWDPNPDIAGLSEWPGGNGYFGSPFPDGVGSDGEPRFVCVKSIMAGGFISHENHRKHGCSGHYGVPRFSARGETYYALPIGNADANATAVIKRNLPYLVARSPSVSRNWGCTPHDCIDSDGRFAVSVRFRHPNGAYGHAEMSTFRIADSAALFYFFSPDNPEMLLKVLNGCSVNGYWWIFGSAATDLRYDILVWDRRRAGSGPEGRVEYEHEGGVIVGDNGFSGVGVINDVQAFRCL